MDDQPGSLPLDDRLGLAADPDTDRDTAAMLAADPDPAVRSELAVNCRHADVLKVLSHDADPNVVWELCSYNRRIPAEILLRIVAAPPLDVPAEIAVKWAAVNPGATAEVLAAVANHPAAAGPDGEELRHRVAIHPNADDDTLRIIKAQGGVTGELAEARLPDTSPARLTQLAEAVAHGQHFRLLKYPFLEANPNTPPVALVLLDRDRRN